MYNLLNSTDDLRQGDIFHNLFLPEIKMGDLDYPEYYETTGDDQKFLPIDFESITEGKKYFALFTARKVSGIVITQDCDAQRANDIAFCEITDLENCCFEYKSIISSAKSEENKSKEIVNRITEVSTKTIKWFYLSENEQIGFKNKKAVDFQKIFTLRRNFLQRHISDLRIGRIDDSVAYPHFREKLSEYFRRYPFNPWYPLNSKEVEIYEKASNGGNKVERYEWNQ